MVISAFQLGGDISAELETYNENGSPVGVSVRNGTSATWTSYNYLKNLQGDILGICSVSGGIVTIYAVYVNETDELTHVFVDGEEIIATPSHPFYCPTKGWTDASHLRAGDILVLVNGEYVVVEKVQHELLERPVKAYNFQVEDYHTYYVASGVLVHNSCKQQLVAGNKSSWNARVSVNGMNDHNPPHAHIFYKSQKMASVTAEGKYLAESFGKMKEGRRFVKENLATIIKGIRTWWE